jgi:hypothetical protein
MRLTSSIPPLEYRDGSRTVPVVIAKMQVNVLVGAAGLEPTTSAV